MKNLIVLILCLVSIPAWSQSVSDVLREKISSLQSKLGTGTPEAMALNAYKAQARNESFHVQAIGRFFEKENKVFKDIKKDAKALEDHFGQIDKWNVLGNKQNVEIELKKLSMFLRETNMKSRLQKYSEKVAELNISEKDTKKIVVDGIKDEIHDIMKKDYDFTYGETGLHELRRNVRWINIGFDVFRNYFTIRKASCTRNEFYNIGIKSSYASVKENPNASFEVGYCSYHEMVGVVEKLGQVKDKLEHEGQLEEKVSLEIFTFAEQTLGELRHHILPGLF